MSDRFLGEIRLFAGAQAPAGWAFCDGASLNTADYQTLYSLIGNTYGGNATAFNLPDLRGRLPIHLGQGPGLTYRALGAKGGAEVVALGEASLPAHTHLLMASTAGASASNPSLNVLANTSGKTVGPAPLNIYQNAANATSTTQLDPTALSSEGGSSPHSNLMYCVGLNFIIATSGLYPPRPNP